MVRTRLRWTFCTLLVTTCVLPVACEKPDSVELGQNCKGSAECKDPADTCLAIGTVNRCSMACAKDTPCPDGYACAVTDPSTRKRGMCLPKDAISHSTVTVK